MKQIIKAAPFTAIKGADTLNGTELNHYRYTFEGLHTRTSEEMSGEIIHLRNAKGAGFRGVIITAEIFATSGGYRGGWLRLTPQECGATKGAICRALNAMSVEDVRSIEIVE